VAAAVTGVAALAAFDRALSGHPHKCSRTAPAGVRREDPRREGEKEKNDGDVNETRDRDTPLPPPNFDGSLTFALTLEH